VLYTGQDRHKPVMYVKMRTTRETPTASPGNQTTTQPVDRSITLSSSKRVAVGLSGKSTGQPSACTRVTADQGKADRCNLAISVALSLAQRAQLSFWDVRGVAHEPGGYR
jgi:hypothetical protein